MNDREIAGINLAFLNRHGPTNVIAFPMREGAYGELTPNLLGDVVICVDTAHRESRLAGRTIEQRLTELLVHGVLHLCGYDDKTPADEKTMRERERHYLLGAGLPG